MLLDRRRIPDDRRGEPRVPAVFAVMNTNGQRVQLAQAEEIGPTGMTLRWPKDASLRPATSVVLSFELPGTSGAIAAEAVVVNDNRAGRFRRTGVRFTTLAPEHAALISDYCTRAG